MLRASLLFLPVLVGSLASQTQTITVPAALATTDGAGLLEAAGFTRAMRQQFLIGPSHLVAARGRELVALRFRRDGHPVEHVPGSLNLTVRLSASTSLDARRPEASFVGNHRSPPVLVFQGPLSVPRSPRLRDRNAATWASPDAVTIPFATPFLYLGGTLCVELEGVPVSGATSSWWSIDAEQFQTRGAVASIGQGCGETASRVTRMASADARTLVPGSTARFLAFGPPNGMAIMFFATQLVGPIDLGFLGAPGCNLYVLPVGSVAASLRNPVAQRPGAATLAVQLPGEAHLVGAAFYTHRGRGRNQRLGCSRRFAPTREGPRPLCCWGLPGPLGHGNGNVHSKRGCTPNSRAMRESAALAAQWAELDAGSMTLTTTNAVQCRLANNPSDLDAAVVTGLATASGLPPSGRVDVGIMPVVQVDLRVP